MSALMDQAKNVLRRNDRGSYTVPTDGLYPFQWNWDSALSALGFAHFDEARAWLEIETLLDHQWPDGMVPHIIFHEYNEGYFPGPEIWATNRPVPTSGITQPPVAGFAAKRLFDRARDKDLATNRATKLLAKIHAWHQWFYHSRDPQNEGLVAIIHPWESGRDNSVDWDAPLRKVPVDNVEPFIRRDTQHANPAHRPTHHQYQQYISLVQKFRSLNWDTSKLHDASPFQVVDPGFNAILIRSCSDLAELAAELGETEIANQSRAFADRGIAAMEKLWSDQHKQYLCMDRVAGSLIESLSVGGLLAVFAPVPKERATRIVERIRELAEVCQYLLPSHDPKSKAYDGTRYWRGPAWLIMNYMVGDGLEQAGMHDIVEQINEDSVKLIQKSGFAEYYDPVTAEPCGGRHFTWTAAMVMEILARKSP